MLGLVLFGVIVCSRLPPLYGNTVTGRWPSLVPGAGVHRTSAGTLTSRVATMKLTIERAALLKALGHVQSVVERRTTIPILSSVLLRARDARLAPQATDTDLEQVERGLDLHAPRKQGVPVMPAVAVDGSRLARVDLVLPEAWSAMPGS